jgi:hypothetical protein
MTKDEIIELALNCGFDADDQVTIESLERFAHLVRAATLEEAAGVVEDMDVQHPKYIAAATRALK